MYECFHCLSRGVIWDNDFNSEDYGYEPGGIIHQCHCTNCGADIIYYIAGDTEDDEEEN